MAVPLSAGVYQWRDANGNIVFGDSPPDSNVATEIELPTLTVADSYSSDGKDKKKKAKQPVKAESEQQVESKPVAQATTAPAVSYERFVVKSPKKGAVIRANNGNVLVKFDLKPALQDGHGLVVYLDGKQVASGAATVFSLKALDRGEHSLFAVVHNQNNNVLKNTPTVQFSVLRASKR